MGTVSTRIPFLMIVSKRTKVALTLMDKETTNFPPSGNMASKDSGYQTYDRKFSVSAQYDRKEPSPSQGVVIANEPNYQSQEKKVVGSVTINQTPERRTSNAGLYDQGYDKMPSMPPQAVPVYNQTTINRKLSGAGLYDQPHDRNQSVAGVYDMMNSPLVDSKSTGFLNKRHDRKLPSASSGTS